MIDGVIAPFLYILTETSTLLSTARGTSIAALVAGTVARLFGYQVLGPKDSLLRQFLVALPAGLLFGIITYSLDFQTKFAYSKALEDLLSLPKLGLDNYLFGLAGAAGGILETIANPNNFKLPTNQSRLSKPRRWIISAIFASDVTITSIVILRVNFDKEGIISGSPPALFIIGALSVLLGIAAGLFEIRQAELIGVTKSSDDTRSSGRSQMAYIGGLVILVIALALLGAVYLSYVASLLGWAIIVYLLILALGFLGLYGVQRVVDEMTEKQTIYPSLLFFAVAVALQFYAIVAF